MPRSTYTTLDAPTSPQQGDVRINVSNNQMEIYSGTAWISPRFTSLTVASGGITLTTGGIVTSTSYASTNDATGVRFEIPGVAGSPTGAVTTTTGNANLVFDTTNRRLFARTGGSWYATASMALV